MDVRADVVERGLRRWIIVLGVMLAPLMETIDSSIVNVALPTIQGNLGATLDEAAWVITGYLIANVIVIPLTPWLQTRFGRRQYFTATVIGFTLASVLCGLAGSIETLIALRIVQGLFGGGLIATAQATLRDTFTAEEVGLAQGIFAVIILVGPIVAPMLGGYLVDAASWQWIFFVNVLPGVFSALVVGTMLRNPTDPVAADVDVGGISLLVLALGSLQFVLEEGERRDWFGSTSIGVAAVSAVVGGVAFVFWELFGTDAPIVDLRVLRYRTVAVGCVLGAGIAATLFGTTLVLPQYTQGVLGFTAFGSGELIFFRALPIMLIAPLVAGLVGSGRVDVRFTMATGFALTALGSVLIAGTTSSVTSFAQLLPGLAIGGFGTAMLFIPLLIAVQTSTSAADAPMASSFITLAFQLGGSVASAALVTLIDRRDDFHAAMLGAGVTLAHPAVRAALQMISPAQLAALVNAQAQTLAFADVAYAAAAIAAVLVPVVFLLRRPQHTITEITFE
ncbi:MAG: DHA2 family efflux MFS transporter permease subunit [Candidatus Lustribacter sp.]|jgi:DHA2 family multidrug resistance protein